MGNATDCHAKHQHIVGANALTPVARIFRLYEELKDGLVTDACGESVCVPLVYCEVIC